MVVLCVCGGRKRGGVKFIMEVLCYVSKITYISLVG